MDFADPCPLVRPGLPLFGFCPSGRDFASALLSDGSSRRPPLRLASPLSHRTWAEDFHLQAVKHARHTRPCGRTERVHSDLENCRQFSTSAHTHHLSWRKKQERKSDRQPNHTVTHVPGLICHPCPRPLSRPNPRMEPTHRRPCNDVIAVRGSFGNVRRTDRSQMFPSEKGAEH